MPRIECPGKSCGFESRTGAISGFRGVFCPNCKNDSSIVWHGSGKDFQCLRCQQLWQEIPCPKCGAPIKDTMFMGIF